MFTAKPSFSEFKTLIQKANLVPMSFEILADLDTPVSAFVKLSEGVHGFLLESVEGGERWARYSFLGTGALAIFRSNGNKVEILEKKLTTRSGKRDQKTVGQLSHQDRHFEKVSKEVPDPFLAFRNFMKRYKPASLSGLPRFYGGAVGYLGYDTVRHFEKLPEQARDVLKI